MVELSPPLLRTGEDVGEADIRAAQRAGGRGLSRPFMAVHPGSGAAIKSWPIARWAEVIRELREQYDANVVLTGGPGERELVREIAARLDAKPLTLAGETTLGQLAALFARCDLVIGGDSGPLHLAAAVGARTVRLYGPTDILEFGPWPRDDRQIALAAGLPCQPCRNLIAPPCGAVELPACLRAITPETVLDATGQLLNLNANAPASGASPASSNCHVERSETSQPPSTQVGL